MKLVYLPVETKSREFDSKCLIALSLINRGVTVLVASSRFRFTNLNLSGVVLLKSAANFELQYIKDLKSKQIKCCALDEEGLVHTGIDREHALRFSQETINELDQVFFNGRAEKEVLERFYEFSTNKGVITGNPRFDIYKKNLRSYYSEEATLIKKKYGRFILIPSRFGMVNFDLNSKDAYLSFVTKLFTLSKEDSAIFEGFEKHTKIIYDAFISLLPKLSRLFPDITI
ncbi:surface carbohydrate biosynthesis protein, partial [Methylicorpusculum sp.]|uniref:surface carbohydrate biosynthesis protein n=1 Tax=Methylicorpusculum sp. TaxID=2713644 RepID=UPI002ABBF67D